MKPATYESQIIVKFATVATDTKSYMEKKIYGMHEGNTLLLDYSILRSKKLKQMGEPEKIFRKGCWSVLKLVSKVFGIWLKHLVITVR